MKNKVFSSAPLPFMGQKRRFIKEFKAALHDYPEDGIYVDLFGGSGLLSHTVKAHYPNATVVYNDYDNYAERIKNIAGTNALLQELREALQDYPKDKKIDGPVRDQVLAIIKAADDAGFVDYITISSSLLFSMKYALNYEQLAKDTLYNKIRLSEYNADGYIEALQITCTDYKDLYQQYKDKPNVVFLVDPPYLSTDVSAYTDNYWKLKDYLDVLQVLQDQRYFYFTSNKSNIIELCEWISNFTAFNPFEYATITTTGNTVNYSSTYTDIMLNK